VEEIVINFFVLETFGLIDGARVYLEEMEKAIPSAGQRERERLQQLARKENWDWVEFDAERQEIDGTFIYWMPRVLTYSLVIYLHSIVEVRLSKLAEYLRKERDHALKVNEIAGSAIERSKVYLTKVVGLKLGSDPGWSTLCDLAFIRNIVVHRGGIQGTDSQTQQQIQQLIQRYAGKLSLLGKPESPDSELIISPDLCRYFLDEIEGFFSRLFAAAGLEETLNKE
jgi:hypothetical protein